MTGPTTTRGFGIGSAARRRRGAQQRPLGLRLAAVGCLVLAVPLPLPDPARLSEPRIGTLIVAIVLIALVILTYLLSAWQFWRGAGVALRFGYVATALLAGASILVAIGDAAAGRRELLVEPAPLSALQLGMMALIVTSLLTPGVRRFTWRRRTRETELGGVGTMSVYEHEGVGVPVSSPEDDYLFLVDGWQSLRMSDLLAGAGAEVLSEVVLNALQNPAWSQPEEWQAALSQYRAAGRRFPPLYRVRLRVEVEPVPEEDLGDVWKGARAWSLA